MKQSLSTLIKYTGKGKNTSELNREILSGIMHRILADQNNNLKHAYRDFLLDNPEDLNQISKFAVRFEDMQFNRFSTVSHKMDYFSGVTHPNPEHTIKNEFNFRMAEADNQGNVFSVFSRC